MVAGWPNNDISNLNFWTKCDKCSAVDLSHFSRNIPDKLSLTITNKRALKNKQTKKKAQKKLVPEGWQREALTPCTHCTADEWSCANRQKKGQTTGFYVGGRCINTLCWDSKGMSFFSSLFFAVFFIYPKDISRSCYWDRWNVLGIHSTLHTCRLERRSNDYCLAHPG